MKPSFLILVCFLSGSISFSQSKRIDSLKYELAIATTDKKHTSIKKEGFIIQWF